MPKATVSHDAVRRDLKTCPGGWVELRTLSYYEMMQRRDITARLYSEQKTGRNVKNEDTLRQVMEVMNVAIMEYEFKNCIVSHNLEDDNGVLLDFSSSMALKSLDPKIGAEINKYIDELNQEDEEDLELSKSAPTLSLSDGKSKHSQSTETTPSPIAPAG